MSHEIGQGPRRQPNDCLPFFGACVRRSIERPAPRNPRATRGPQEVVRGKRESQLDAGPFGGARSSEGLPHGSRQDGVDRGRIEARWSCLGRPSAILGEGAQKPKRGDLDRRHGPSTAAVERAGVLTRPHALVVGRKRRRAAPGEMISIANSCGRRDEVPSRANEGDFLLTAATGSGCWRAIASEFKKALAESDAGRVEWAEAERACVRGQHSIRGSVAAINRSID